MPELSEETSGCVDRNRPVLQKMIDECLFVEAISWTMRHHFFCASTRGQLIRRFGWKSSERPFQSRPKSSARCAGVLGAAGEAYRRA